MNQGMLDLASSTINTDFDNQGMLNISGITTFNGAVFDQTSGTIALPPGSLLDKNTGDFNWIGGSIGTAPTDTGTLQTLGGANFNFVGSGARVIDGPNVSLFGAVSIPGGSLDVQSGTFNAIGTTTISADTSMTNTGGTFSLAALTVSSNSTLDMTNGIITASGLTTIDAGSTIDVSGGDFQPTTIQLDGLLTGSSDITVSGLIIWGDGQMAGTGTTFANGGIELDGFFANRSIDRDVEHTGTHTWSASGSIPGTGTITHQSGILTLDSRFFIDSPFVNNATVVVNVPGDLIGFDSVFNEGIFQINDGTFRIDDVSNSTTGSYTIGPTAVLLIRNDYTFNGGSISGSGLLDLDGSFFDVFGGTVNPQTLNLTSGTDLLVHGGSFVVSGMTNVSGFSTIGTAGGVLSLDDVDISSTGDLNVTSGSVSVTGSSTVNSGVCCV